MFSTKYYQLFIIFQNIFRAAEGARRGPEEKPDLQKLGLKFGGQISITSSGNQPGAAKKPGQPAPVDNNQGVSVTKMKGGVPVGDPVSIKDAKKRGQNV